MESKGIWLAIAMIACVGCQKIERREAKIEDETTRTITVALDWNHEPDYAGIYYAEAKGLFEAAGIKVKIIEGSGSFVSAAAVAAGKYPLAFCSGGATALSFNTTTNLVSLAVLYPKVPTVVFGMASRDVKSIFDLRGKRIGIYPGSINNSEWAAFLLAHGLKEDFAKVVPISGSDLQLIKSKNVDAALNYAPMSPTALELDASVPPVQGERTFEFPLADFGVKAYGLNLVTSRESLVKDGALLRKIASIICEGYRQGCANPEDLVKVFCERFPDKDPVYVKRGWAKVCKLVTSQKIPGEQTATGWSETLETYRKLGLLEKNVTPKMVMP